MNKNKDVILTYASALQEMGTLFFVFGPMYTTFDTEISGWLLMAGVLAWIAVAFAVFRLGIEIQRRNS